MMMLVFRFVKFTLEDLGFEIERTSDRALTLSRRRPR